MGSGKGHGKDGADFTCLSRPDSQSSEAVKAWGIQHGLQNTLVPGHGLHLREASSGQAVPSQGHESWKSLLLRAEA